MCNYVIEILKKKSNYFQGKKKNFERVNDTDQNGPLRLLV